jgi:hypothetical protein
VEEREEEREEKRAVRTKKFCETRTYAQEPLYKYITTSLCTRTKKFCETDK